MVRNPSASTTECRPTEFGERLRRVGLNLVVRIARGSKAVPRAQVHSRRHPAHQAITPTRQGAIGYG